MIEGCLFSEGVENSLRRPALFFVHGVLGTNSHGTATISGRFRLKFVFTKFNLFVHDTPFFVQRPL